MIFRDFYKGEARSKYDMDGFDSLSKVDIHSELGSARCQNDLVSAGSVVDEPSLSAMDIDGNIYFFSTTSGKVWKRAHSNGAYSLIHTNANGQHYGCHYFNGDIYYATATYLGKLDISALTFNDTFGTLSADVSIAPDMAPMYVLNLSLWIGAGSYIDKVDSSGTFTANALDLPANYLVSALTEDYGSLLIGTIIGGKVPHCKVFLWDTFSDSWIVEDSVPEIGINTFLNADNEIFAQCGTSGQIYQWNGATMIKKKKIRNVITSQWQQKGTVFLGKPLIAAGNKIYSYHSADVNLPRAIVHEYTASNNIVSITPQGSTIFVSSTSGLEEIDSYNKSTATITTPEIQGNVNSVIVHYDSLPDGTSIGIATKVDNAGSFTTQTVITDTINKTVTFNGGLGKTNFMQAKITLTPSGTATPIIKSIEIK